MTATPVEKQNADETDVPQGFELAHGDLVEKQTSGEHGRAQGNVMGSLVPAFGRRPPGGPPDRPGGWWLATEALVQFAPGLRYRPDIAGWRRERLSAPPSGTVVTDIPDWICEVISPSNASNDTITKMADYHQAKVGHYWLLDPRDQTLEVYRYTKDGYLWVLGATREQRVRAEPFEPLEVHVGVFFGDDEP